MANGKHQDLNINRARDILKDFTSFQKREKPEVNFCLINLEKGTFHQIGRPLNFSSLKQKWKPYFTM